ncbi:clavata3/esr-related 12 family protein [Populus alba x Populus x berolinensis]|nr:clavata3/esr-related 12 family protein [Populus alba x Populus x berolinensis]
MALKISHFPCALLCLYLLLLAFHELRNFKSKINSNKDQINNISSSSISHHPFHNRKVLVSKFDFTPFQKHHQQQHENPLPDEEVHKKAARSEIDPRYGVEKRLVPTGPNPEAGAQIIGKRSSNTFRLLYFHLLEVNHGKKWKFRVKMSHDFSPARMCFMFPRPVNGGRGTILSACLLGISPGV